MQKFQKVRYTILGMLIALSICGMIIPVLAETGQKNIAVNYNNIKLIFDGVQKTPTDANGNTVEPFTYNGTTFVPLRFVSEAFGKDVGWDGATATVTIGARQTTFLDTMGVYEVSSNFKGVHVESIGENDNFGSGVKFVMAYEDVKEGDITKATYSYLLNGEYARFISGLYCSQEYYVNPATVKIYGDGNVLYTSPGISRNTLIQDIDLNVENVRVLTFEISSVLSSTDYSNRASCTFILGDARLTR